MSGIAEALVATAVGIAVALPAVAAYNYFQRRVASLLAGTEVLSNLVLAYLSGQSDPGGPPSGGGSARAGSTSHEHAAEMTLEPSPGAA